MYRGKIIAVVIPAFNEAAAIGNVINNLPEFVDTIVVGDNESSDSTAKIARSGGAIVVTAQKRGYGSACLAALAYLIDTPPDIVAFVDGDGSDNPERLAQLLEPLVNDTCDLCLSSRILGGIEPGALSLSQRLGNWLITRLINKKWHQQFTDLGPFRAITWKALTKIDMEDQDFGWTVEMQVKALQHGYRIQEIPVFYRCRQGGISKISGSLITSLLAGKKMLFWAFKIKP